MGSGNSREEFHISQREPVSPSDYRYHICEKKEEAMQSGEWMDGERSGMGSGESEESQSLYRLLHHLIRMGQVCMEGEAGDSDSDSSDDERPISLKEALRTTEALMMGGRRRRAGTPDLSSLKANDLLQLLRMETGMVDLEAHHGVLDSGRGGLQRRLLQRELGLPPLRNGAPSLSRFRRSDRVHLMQNFLPNRKRILAKHRTKTFCSQFTDNGNVLITASQDHMIRFYKRGCKDRWVQYDELTVRNNILDVAVSPDGRHLIYGTWSDYIHEFSLQGRTSSDSLYQAYNLESPDYRFCVFSLRFSSDGSEILAGASDRRLYVYDREYKKLMLKLEAHEDDINAVCFGDHASNIVYSGGDDGLVKVWDRRELREDSKREVGVFAGHADGITFIDSRGDGRYLISNSKDQSIKLWDVRRFSSSAAAEVTRQAVAGQAWDYRWQSVPHGKRQQRKLDGDSSVMSYRGGHTVQHTLIRAYFSPAASTAQRYIYTGCARGGCVIYDVSTGEVVRRLEGHNSCVRDLNWHPVAPEIVTSSWDGKTIRWTYDERRKRVINPEAGENAETGDEDSEDADGNPIIREHLERMRKASMGRKRTRSDDGQGETKTRPGVRRSERLRNRLLLSRYTSGAGEEERGSREEAEVEEEVEESGEGDAAGSESLHTSTDDLPQLDSSAEDVEALMQ